MNRMPKEVIDYSNTIIYKITCKDPNVKDVYVGHTTNFVQRKHAHKNTCNNEKIRSYNCKLYQVIRNNGGWNNWTMEIVNFFNCNDHYEARKKEQEYFELLNATLNSIEPMPKPKVKPEPEPKNLVCELCNFITLRNQDYEMHLVTAKHKRKLLETNINVNIPLDSFHCNECNFTTLKKNLFEKHKNNIKHIQNINREPTANKHICHICNKEYLNNSGLWKHKKTCQVLETKTELTNELREPEIKSPTLTIELFMELMQQNKELQNCLMEAHNKMVELSNNREPLNLENYLK